MKVLFEAKSQAVLTRAAALFILFGAFALIWFFIIGPSRDYYLANLDQISQEMRTIAGLKSIADLEPALASTARAEDGAAFASNFLTGTEDTLIMADLQTKLRLLALKHKSQLNSARTLPPKTIEGLTYLGLKLELRGDLRDIHQIVYGIETQEPFLFIDKANFRLSEQRNFASPTTPQAVPTLVAELDIFGAKRPEPNAPAAVETAR